MDTVALFKGIQMFSIAVLFLLFVYAKLQKPSEMQKYATMIAFGAILMLLGYLLEMNGDNLESSFYGSMVSYVGEPFLLASVFLLVCTFYGIKIPRPLFVLMMCYAALITVCVFSNPYHHLYYSYVGYDPTLKFSPLVLKRGPLYFLNLAAVAGYNLGIVIIVLLRFNKTVSPFKRRLSIYTMLMTISAVLGFALYWVDIADGYDTTMFGLTAGSIFLFILFFRCRIFDVVDMAKDYALDISTEGLLVFDDSGNLIYRNTAAAKIVDKAISKDYIRNIRDGKTYYTHARTVYSVNASSILHNGDYIGKSVEIHDITESHNYSRRLEDAVHQATEKLETIQRTIVGSFASLVEARSLETGDHIKRVSRYTAMIANSLAREEKYSCLLTEEYITMLIQSAPLHDVGKISISDLILLKPGRLTPEEFEEMKKHSEMGAKVIESTMKGLESEAYVKMASEIALYHHERWDGTGYPAGLKGEEIPIAARIVAVADCYDAMTSQRCYKEAFPDEKALAIIREESGTHFDPEVVEAFLNTRES